MARWKIITPHYLHTVDPAEWEYSETDRKTGRQVRKKFNVPRLIDPRDPSDWTNKWGHRDDVEGETILCQPNKGTDSDVAFLGDPTPDMIPIDDEAREISASFAKRWAYKPEGADIGYSQSLIDGMQTQMAELQAKPQTVEVAGLADLVAAIGMMVQNQSPARRI